VHAIASEKAACSLDSGQSSHKNGHKNVGGSRRIGANGGDPKIEQILSKIADFSVSYLFALDRRRSRKIAVLAETEGFEPSVRVNPVRRFSKPLVSATHPRLQTRAARAL
jgi:hypothetical protein